MRQARKMRRGMYWRMKETKRTITEAEPLVSSPKTSAYLRRPKNCTTCGTISTMESAGRIRFGT